MTSEQLRATRDAQPFQPFVIHMTDGREFPVPHPEYLAIAPHGRGATVFHSESAAFHYVDVPLISTLSVEPSHRPA